MSGSNHATWKYLWDAKTVQDNKLEGVVMFPVTFSLVSKERGEVLNDPMQIAKEMAERNAQDLLESSKKIGKIPEDDSIIRVMVFQTADNRIR